MAEAQRFGSAFKAEIERLKSSYGTVEATHSAEVRGLRSALEAMGEQLQVERLEAEREAAEKIEREADLRQRWNEEREALSAAHAAELESLQEGWIGQRDKLMRELDSERERFSSTQAAAERERQQLVSERQRADDAWKDERAMLRQALETARDEATREKRAAEAARGAHDEVRHQLKQSELLRKDHDEAQLSSDARHAAALEDASNDLEFERSARQKLEEWAAAAQERVTWHERSLEAAAEREAAFRTEIDRLSAELSAAQQEAKAAATAREAEQVETQTRLVELESLNSEAAQRFAEAERRAAEERARAAEETCRLGANLSAVSSRLATVSVEREEIDRSLKRATESEREAVRVSRATADSAADALRVEAMRSYEARTALAEAHAHAESMARRRELQLQTAGALGNGAGLGGGVALDQFLGGAAPLSQAPLSGAASPVPNASTPTAPTSSKGAPWGEAKGEARGETLSRNPFNATHSSGLAMANHALQASAAPLAPQLAVAVTYAPACSPTTSPPSCGTPGRRVVCTPSRSIGSSRGVSAARPAARPRAQVVQDPQQSYYRNLERTLEGVSRRVLMGGEARLAGDAAAAAAELKRYA